MAGAPARWRIAALYEEPRRSPIIEARGLTNRFGKVEALASLDIVAESGHVTALLGPNGSGNTTFVSAVATLLRPESNAFVPISSRCPAGCRPSRLISPSP